MQQQTGTILSVVVPLYNEESNFSSLLQSLKELETNLPAVKFEFIFVDDGSTDRTYELASAAAKTANITALKLARNYGSHAAIAAGFLQANGNCALFIAGDMQDPPELISEMLEAWQQGYKIVWAARSKVEGKSLSGTFFSNFYWHLFNLAVDHPVVAGGVDFALIDRTALLALKEQAQAAIPIFAQITETGYPAKTIRYVKRERAGGKSGWTLKKKFALVFQTLSFSTKPFRLFCLAGMLLTGFSLIYAQFASSSPALTISGHIFILALFGLAILLMEYLGLRRRASNSIPRFQIERIADRGHERAL
ncbi:MAG: glycosyltransferase family 2 protein [Candidatus Obscuribacterales bacterium]|nr:glycosyltransferase family 2 protein [Candidatus Obscuribacterales bacterium]